jgi:hypothetical protein
MIGCILALTLALAQPLTCTVVNFDGGHVVVVCGADELVIPSSEWPLEQWGRAALGESYPLSEAGLPIALSPAQRQAQVDADQLTRERTLNEQRRWRKHPTQTQGEPKW